MDKKEETKFLRVYKDSNEENSGYCVENIHGKFIVCDSDSDDNYVLIVFNQLPEEFNNYFLIDKNECEKPEYNFLGRHTVNFGTLLSSTEDIKKLRINIAYELGKLHALLNNSWVLESYGIAKLTFRTQLLYMSRDEMKGMKNLRQINNVLGKRV